MIERVDVSGDGGCIKHVLRRGAGRETRGIIGAFLWGSVPANAATSTRVAAKAIPGRTVNAHYDGKLTNGVQFDASRKRGKEFSFPLGAGRVIK